MASVERRGPTWIVRWREDGKQRKQAFGTEAEAEAMRSVVGGREHRVEVRRAVLNDVIRDEIARLESELARLRQLIED